MTTKNVCQECINHTGGCCTSVNLSIHISELNSFIEYIMKNGLPKGQKIENLDDEKDIYLYNSGNEKCIFLDENNQCKIYSNRPLVCRMYPILWKTKENFFIDMSCPLAFIVPIKNILESIKESKNQEQLKILDDLNFNPLLYQYLSVSNLVKEYPVLKIIKETDREK